RIVIRAATSPSRTDIVGCAKSKRVGPGAAAGAVTGGAVAVGAAAIGAAVVGGGAAGAAVAGCVSAVTLASTSTWGLGSSIVGDTAAAGGGFEAATSGGFAPGA